MPYTLLRPDAGAFAPPLRAVIPLLEMAIWPTELPTISEKPWFHDDAAPPETWLEASDYE